MKQFFRNVFASILIIFERGDEPYNYKPLNRIILNVMGVLFSGLAIAVAFAVPTENGFGYMLPVVVFLALGITCLVVGILGNERAVCKIWGNK
ncbi:hypothetical protein EOL70_06350 [Leucothrix sargassi]|nr:hypothetical protein EOL70_06350 [Leucothrix sargassi]